MKRLRYRSAATSLALAVLSACDPGAPAPGGFERVPVGSPTGTSTVVIGLVGTMTGEDSWRGDDAFEGADLGVHVLNRGLPAGVPPFELVTLDDRGDPDLALQHLETLAGESRTAGIVYAGPAEGLPPAAAVLDAAGIPAILCYGDLASGGLLRGTLFQMSPPYLAQARAIARYLVRDRGYRRIGILTRDGLSGRTAERASRSAVRALGARPVVAATPLDGDLEGAVRQMRARRVEAVVVEASPALWRGVVGALEDLGSGYRTTAAARRARRNPRAAWRPQVAGFDLALAAGPPEELPPPGAVVADTYARGAHYLPVPSFERFRTDFGDWWGSSPQGWELRAYDAARAIGWAWNHSDSGRPGVAAALATLRGVRFGGLEVHLDDDDHVLVDPEAVGLWVVPRPGAAPELAAVGPSLPWVPLARTWSTRGGRTTIDPQDWRFLFTGEPGPRSAAPRFARSKFGVTTPRSDPVH